MKRTTWVILTILFVCMAGFFIYQRYIHVPDSAINTDRREKALSGETFITGNLLDNGIIHTDFKGNPNYNVMLSESIGLWLLYAAEKGDDTIFKPAYTALKKQFLSPENLVMWEIKDGQPANTNALIDDLRIIKALFIQGEKTRNTNYIQTAKQIAKAVKKYNWRESMFADYYDTMHQYRNEKLTLSYLMPDAFQLMGDCGILSKQNMKDIEKFIRQIPVKNGFYPKEYDFATKQFNFDSTINLIDQLYVAIHLEKSNIDTGELYNWLKQTFYDKHLLYGRYDSAAKQNTVQYESPAVYALTILYSLQRNDPLFSKDVYQQLKTLQITNSASPYFGGFVSDESTHSFDNLLGLLAERKLIHETAIPYSK